MLDGCEAILATGEARRARSRVTTFQHREVTIAKPADLPAGACGVLTKSQSNQ